MRVAVGVFVFLVQGLAYAQEVEEIMLQVPVDDDSGQVLVREGELIIRKNAPATVVFCHGFTCEKEDTRIFHAIFDTYNILFFDFRAHGKRKEGQCCSFGKFEKYEIKAAVDFIKKDPRLKHLPIVGYGFSMGAVSLIEAQAEWPYLFSGLVLDSPFDGSEAVLRRGLEKVRFELFGYDVLAPLRAFLKRYPLHPTTQALMKFFLKTMARMDATSTPTCLCAVNPAASAQKIIVPTMIIGCENDEKIPADAFTQVYEQLSATNKKLHITSGRCHFDSFFSDPGTYTSMVRAFLDQVLLANRTLSKTTMQQKKDCAQVKGSSRVE